MVRYNEALSNSLTPCEGKCTSLERRKATIKAPCPTNHGEPRGREPNTNRSCEVASLFDQIIDCQVVTE